MRYFIDENGFINIFEPDENPKNPIVPVPEPPIIHMYSSPNMNANTQLIKPFVSKDTTTKRGRNKHENVTRSSSSIPKSHKKPDLIQAVRQGDTTLVENIVARNPQAIHTVKNGQTPLHIAVAHGRFTIVHILVLHGASLATRDSNGQTPMMLAQSLNQPEYFNQLKRVVFNAQRQMQTGRNQSPINEERALVATYREGKVTSSGFPCPYCGQIIKRTAIAAHIKRHQSKSIILKDSKPSRPVVESPLKSIELKLIACPHCKAQVRQDRLEKHVMKVHSAIRKELSHSAGPSKPKANSNPQHAPVMPHKPGKPVQDAILDDSNRDIVSSYELDSIYDGSRGWGHAWRDNGSYGSYPGFDGMDDESNAG